MPEGLSAAHRRSPPRVLLTTDAVGGVWRYTIDLARGLSDLGIDPIIAVLGPAPVPAQCDEAAAIPRLRLVQTGLPLDWTADTPADLAHTSDRLAALAALTGVASIHLHAPALVGTATWPAPIVAVHHSCVGTWWRAVRAGPPPPDFAWRIEATATGLRHAQAIIAPTAAHAAAIRAVYGALDITIVHNGIRTTTPPVEQRASSSRALAERSRAANPNLPTRPRDRAILTAGRLWDEGKAITLLDQAAPSLTAPIHAAGPTKGPNGTSIHLPNLHLLGTLDPKAMATAYADATIFASMATYEPFGLAVLEAASAGMRLVLSDIPTFRELWQGAATFVSYFAVLPASLPASLSASLPASLPVILEQALDTPGDGGAQERAGRYTIEKTIDATLAIHRTLVPAT